MVAIGVIYGALASRHDQAVESRLNYFQSKQYRMGYRSKEFRFSQLEYFYRSYRNSFA